MARIYEPLEGISPQEIVDEQRKQFQPIGSERRIPGLRLYEYDLTTGEVREASAEKTLSMHIQGPMTVSRRVDARELCLYVQALNEAVAIKKFRSMLRRKSVREQILGKTTNFNDSKNGRKKH